MEGIMASGLEAIEKTNLGARQEAWMERGVATNLEAI